jgi:hypothetical protein
MKPHEQRVVDEKTELDAKLLKLYEFINTNPLFHQLNDIDRSLLLNQRGAMHSYSEILARRIARFPKDA